MTEHSIEIRDADRSEIAEIGALYAHATTMAESRQETGQYTCVTPQALDAYTGQANDMFNMLARQGRGNACARTLVAVHEDRIVGYIMTAREGNKGDILQLCVDPSHWGTNVARDLMRAAEQVFIDNNLHAARGATAKVNARSQHFLRKMGWHVTGVGRLTLSYGRDFD